MRCWIFIGLLLFLSGCTLQHGSTKDIVQGYDNGILWNHLYLKNDHNTAYCFDDERFIPLLDDAQKNDYEVIVSYETYLIRGRLDCMTTNNYENVVVTGIQKAEVIR